MNRKPTRPALAVLVLLGMLSAGAQAAAVTSK